MFPEFAYSWKMQLILATIAFLLAFVFVYHIAKLILAVHGEKASTAQKSVFAFVVGIVLNLMWVYGMYYIGGRNSFSPQMYLMVVTPNPVFALLYYLCGIKILKLSSIRSVKLMGHVFLYCVLIKSVCRLIGSVFFAQTGARYNYMLDAVSQLVFIAVFFAIYFVTHRLIRNFGSVVKLGDKLFVNIKKEVALYFIKSVAIYALMVGVPYFISEAVAANAVVLIILALAVTISLLLDFYKVTGNGAKNKEAHIAVLKQKLRALRGQTPPDLFGRLNENLSLISILISRYEYARSRHVDMTILLHGNVENFFIDNTDACSIIDGLLRGAIETAALSEERRVYLAIETKHEDMKLIVVSNSTPVQTKSTQLLLPVPAWYGRGIADARRVLAGYGNCALHLDYYNFEMSAYLEIRGM